MVLIVQCSCLECNAFPVLALITNIQNCAIFYLTIFRWISQHLAVTEQETLNSLLEAPNGDSLIKISYSEYNWNLNGSKL